MTASAWTTASTKGTARAADFAVQLRRDGAMTGLDASAFEQLCEAMRLHSDGQTENAPAIRVC
jgi:hypothetical protein